MLMVITSENFGIMQWEGTLWKRVWWTASGTDRTVHRSASSPESVGTYQVDTSKDTSLDCQSAECFFWNLILTMLSCSIDCWLTGMNIFVLYNAIQWQWQNLGKTWHSRTTPCTLPLCLSYGVFFMSYSRENWPPYIKSPLDWIHSSLYRSS